MELIVITFFIASLIFDLQTGKKDYVKQEKNNMCL